MIPLPYKNTMPGTERFVDGEDGSRLRTLFLQPDDGSTKARTVVLAHGFGSDANSWAILAPKLAGQGFAVLAFDQRCHGSSTAGRNGVSTAAMISDYGAIVDAYDLRDAILVGHSMGGFLSLAFLLEGREDSVARIGALMLMATFAGNVTKDAPQNKLQIPLIKYGVLQKLLRVDPIKHGFTKSLVGDHYHQDMAEAFVPGFLRADHQQLIPILEAMVEEDRYSLLPTLDMPCTVVVGTEDKTTPEFHSVALHEGIAGSRSVALIGSGHALNWEAPDQVAALIDELNSVSKAQGPSD